MKTMPQADATMERLADKLKGQRVALLTLLEGRDELCSRPMTPLQMDGAGAIWMMASRRTMEPLLGTRGSAPANLAFADPARSDYVSISGTAQIVDDAERKRELWSLAGRVWFDGPADPDLVLLQFRPRHADLWDGPGNAATRLLAMGTSVLAGREIGLGHKEEIDVASPRR